MNRTKKKNDKVLLKTLQFLNRRFAYWIIFLIIGLVLFSSMYNNVKPIVLDVTKFEPSKETIRSPFTIEDVNATERARQEAANEVEAQYVLKQEIGQNRVDLIRSIYDSAIELQDELMELNLQSQVENADEELIVKSPTLKEKVGWLKEKLTENVIVDLSNSTLETLVNSNKSDLTIAKDAAVTAVNNVMSKEILSSEVENARDKVEEELSFVSIPENLKIATIELARYAITQNYFYDPEKTEEMRQQAEENVDPVYILQGQIIVEEGQLVNQKIWEQLELIGLVNTDFPYMPFIGLIIFVLALVGVIYSYFNENRRNETTHKELIIFSVILVTSIVIMKGISSIPIKQYDISFVFPAALCAMLIKILLNDRLGIIGTIVLATSGAVIFNGQSSGSFHLTVAIYIIFSGLAGIAFLSNQNQRSKIFQAGLFVSAINILVIIAMLFIPNTKFSVSQYLIYGSMGIFSGISSAVLTIGFLPFFEAGFGILSTMKLIELSNPNHPLLKKILTEAPGTYHHSVMVANLADSACEAIGANGLLARVACYYHDIGKTRRPNFFIENQMNAGNPHDHLPPETSRDIIIAHAKDGAEILKKHHMPKEIFDVAMQHHGTSLLKYFYHKAKESGKEVREEDFRYPGPKPQTKETAIISIADSVEAAVRSMKNPDKEKIETLVKNIIKDKLNDDQFSESNLTLKELKIIEETLCETLHGIFHNRIEYPEMEEKGENNARN